MPNHAMCALKVHLTNLNHVEKSTRTFLWYGKDINRSGKCLVQWEKVCLPKEAAGLGILNLREQNKALLIKNLYKFYNRQDLPWVDLLWKAYYQNGSLPSQSNCKGSFWWRSCVALQDHFKLQTSCSPGNGKSVLLWHDKWKKEPIQFTLPQLFSFAKNKNITIEKACQIANDDIYDMFKLPLSLIAVEQCNTLLNMLQYQYQAASVNQDEWKFHGKNIKYPTKKVYLSLINAPQAPPPYKWIWKSACLPKHKFFFWLLIQDRLNTKELMVRKNFFVESSRCVLCDEEVEESLLHLFFTCDFSQSFWWRIGEEWNPDLELIDMIIEAKGRSLNHFFKEAMIAGCWSIWNHRNKIIFDGVQRDMELCYMSFKESIGMIRHRVKPSLIEGMEVWLDLL